MKKLLLLIITCVACTNNSNVVTNKAKKDSLVSKMAITDFNEKTLDFLINNKEDKYLEFPDIYDTTANSIPEDADERLVLVEKLKNKGFKIVDWGRGNHPPLGPRIVIYTLKNKDCECEVSKIYYYTTSKSTYTMTERIKCKNIDK